MNNINFETVLVPQETSIELPTLSMVSFDSDDPDYALVKKLGADVTSGELSAGPAQGDNSVVFLVATQAMISQPTASDNLKVIIALWVIIGVFPISNFQKESFLEISNKRPGMTQSYSSPSPKFQKPNLKTGDASLFRSL